MAATRTVNLETGLTLKVMLENAAGEVWNGTAFVAFVLADIADYLLDRAESPASSGRYPFTIPSGAATALGGGTLVVKTFESSGSTWPDDYEFVFDWTVEIDASGDEIELSSRLAESTYTASTGDGDYPIDHDGGTGAGDAAATVDGVDSAADIMRYTASGVGIDNVTIRAYLKSDYDAGTRAIVGSTYTGSDGRWIAPISLDSGTYYIIAGKSGSFPNHTSTVVVP